MTTIAPEDMFAELLELDNAVLDTDYLDAETGEWDMDGLEDDLRIAREKRRAPTSSTKPPATPRSKLLRSGSKATPGSSQRLLALASPRTPRSLAVSAGGSADRPRTASSSRMSISKCREARERMVAENQERAALFRAQMAEAAAQQAEAQAQMEAAKKAVRLARLKVTVEYRQQKTAEKAEAESKTTQELQELRQRYSEQREVAFKVRSEERARRRESLVFRAMTVKQWRQKQEATATQQAELTRQRLHEKWAEEKAAMEAQAAAQAEEEEAARRTATISRLREAEMERQRAEAERHMLAVKREYAVTNSLVSEAMELEAKAKLLRGEKLTGDLLCTKVALSKVASFQRLEAAGTAAGSVAVVVANKEN